MANVRLVVDVTRNDKGELVAAAKELDQVADKQERLTKKTKESESAFKDWGATMLKAFSAGAVLSFTEKSLRAQAEQEASINKLNLALANQGKFTDALSASLQDFAGEIQNTTTYADDAALSLMGMFASFGMGEQEIKRSTRAAADFAAATGKSLQEAGEAIAKASAGNVTALQKMGFQFQEGATDAQKFESALRQIEQRFGGSAANATRTYIGQLEQLKNAFGEAQEGLGKFLGTVASAETAFGPIIGFLNAVGKFFGQTLVLVFSEFRAQVIEFNAWLNRQMAKFLAGDTGIKATIGGMAGTVLRKALGIEQSDIDHMRRFADELDKMAEAEREAGNQAAAAAGNIAKVKNATDAAGRSTKDATKEAKELAKVLFEIHIATARLAKDVNEDFFAENLRIASARARQEAEAFRALYGGGLGTEHPRGRDIASHMSGEIVNFDAQVDKSAKNFQTRFTVAVQAVQTAIQILGVKTESMWMKVFQGALSGAFAGAGTGFQFGGPKGAAAGAIIGAVVGGVGSWLRARREAEQRALDERVRAESAGVAQLKSIWAEYEAFRKQTLELGVKGLADVFTYFGTLTNVPAERLQRMGTIGFAVFESLRKSGMSFVDALKAMGPALSAAVDAGLSEDGPLGFLFGLQRKITENEALVRAAEGLGSALDALRVTGHLTQETFNDVMAEAGQMFAELEAKGVVGNEALAVLAPTLFRLKKAAEDFGFVLDDNTRRMIEQAGEAHLFDDMADPMEQLVEIQKSMLLVLAELAKVFGAVLPTEVRKFIDSLNAIPKKVQVDVGFGGDGNGGNGDGDGDGGKNKALGKNKSRTITPLSHGGGGAGGGFSAVNNYSINVVVEGDGDAEKIAREINKQLRNNSAGVRSRASNLAYRASRRV